MKVIRSMRMKVSLKFEFATPIINCIKEEIYHKSVKTRTFIIATSTYNRNIRVIFVRTVSHSSFLNIVRRQHKFPIKLMETKYSR